MKGRKPTPAKLINLKTSKISILERNRREEIEMALQSDKILKCPSHLTKDAKREWKRIMKLYEKMQADILSDLDRQALIMYCEAVSNYNAAQKDWHFYQSTKENIKENFKKSNSFDYNEFIKSIKDIDESIDIVSARMIRQIKVINPLTEQLCLTPVGRARMKNANTNSPKDPLDLLGEKQRELMS